jgi:hypothetical protein
MELNVGSESEETAGEDPGSASGRAITQIHLFANCRNQVGALMAGARIS